jgi:nucleotide-binding universal stress UspA family protein
MSDILVLLEPGADPTPVRRVARAVTTALAGALREEHLPSYDESTPDAVVTALDAPGVRLAVLPYAAGRSARLVEDVIGRTRTPVVVVPVGPGATAPGVIARVLAPLDGTSASATTVSEVVAMFAASGADLVVLHVFDRSTVPPMWDQAAHAGRSWSEEFLARFCDLPEARIELRGGLPGERVLDVAAEEHVDLIVLGWSQHLSPGRARTVRDTLRRTTVPVLLLPAGVPALHP